MSITKVSADLRERLAQAIHDVWPHCDEGPHRSDYVVADALMPLIEAAQAEAWRKGHDYQGDGWNSDAHDPDNDNPYHKEVQ